MVCDNLTNELCLNIKFGFDGSGSHSIFHQKNNAQTNNIFMSMFCPLEMKTEAGYSLMESDGITVKKGDDSYKVKVKIMSYMLDMNLYLGLGRAYCDLCTCSKQHCLDPERIEVGFIINREVEDLINLFNELEQEDGKILKRKGDYDIRAGLTTKPIPTNESPPCSLALI